MISDRPALAWQGLHYSVSQFGKSIGLLPRSTRSMHLTRGSAYLLLQSFYRLLLFENITLIPRQASPAQCGGRGDGAEGGAGAGQAHVAKRSNNPAQCSPSSCSWRGVLIPLAAACNRAQRRSCPRGSSSDKSQGAAGCPFRAPGIFVMPRGGIKRRERCGNCTPGTFPPATPAQPSGLVDSRSPSRLSAPLAS